jgi:hypothetical protein
MQVTFKDAIDERGKAQLCKTKYVDYICILNHLR